MSGESPEHRGEGFQCIECGDSFETSLGLDRHRQRCQREMAAGDSDD